MPNVHNYFYCINCIVYVKKKYFLFFFNNNNINIFYKNLYFSYYQELEGCSLLGTLTRIYIILTVIILGIIIFTIFVGFCCLRIMTYYVNRKKN